MDKQNIFSTPGMPGVERTNGAVNINNSNKRSTYCFNLLRVVLKQ